MMNALNRTLLISTVLLLGCGTDGDELVNSNDFGSIQEAIDSLPSTGGTVVVPPGVHEVTEPLRIRLSNTTLRGEGRSSVIYNSNQQGRPAVLAGADHDPQDNPLWGITISNLCITGDGAAVRDPRAWSLVEGHSSPGGDGIRANYCYNSLFDRLWLVGNGGNGISLYVCYEDPRIQSCNIVYNQNAGIRLEGCHDIVVSANQLEENFEEGLLAINCANVTASGNNIDDHRGVGIVLEDTIGSTLSGNLSENSRSSGLILKNSHSNTFSAGTVRGNFSDGGVKLIGSNFNTISGCNFERNLGQSLLIDQDSRQNNVNGNTFSSERYSGEEGMISEGLRVAGRENVLSANIVSPHIGPGLVLSGNSQSVFGNTFVCPDGQPGIVIRDLKDSYVHSNLMVRRTGKGTSGIVTIAGTNSGNRIERNR